MERLRPRLCRIRPRIGRLRPRLTFFRWGTAISSGRLAKCRRPFLTRRASSITGRRSPMYHCAKARPHPTGAQPTGPRPLPPSSPLHPKRGLFLPTGPGVGCAPAALNAASSSTSAGDGSSGVRNFAQQQCSVGAASSSWVRFGGKTRPLPTQARSRPSHPRPLPTRARPRPPQARRCPPCRMTPRFPAGCPLLESSAMPANG